MKINFVGNYTTGYIGEVADETHLCDELEALGHQVKRVPRDVWKAYCDGMWEDQWEKQIPIRNADVNIVCKWHHFSEGKYINKLREWTKYKQAPVFYWIWDYMDFPASSAWHIEMARAADLYLTNELGDFNEMVPLGIKPYYFPFDVSSKEFDRVENQEKKYDVVFFGSCVGKGDRIEWIKEINKTHKIVCFGWNHEGWKSHGIEAYLPVYGHNFVEKVAQTKICLQFSVNDHCYGYWSNRVGKVLTVGGFLLAKYIPGMELFLRDGAEYFSSVEEANQKITYYLEHEEERNKIAQRGYEIGRDRFTSQERVKELIILIDRYLKGAFK